MALRFQHLIDARTDFKASVSDLNQEEIDYLVSYLSIPVSQLHISYLYLYFNALGLIVIQHGTLESTFTRSTDFFTFVPLIEHTMSNQQIFEAFLKHHRAYAGYHRERTKDYAQIFEDCASGPGDYVSASFVWSSTAKGTSYWGNLSNKWRIMAYDLKLSKRT